MRWKRDEADLKLQETETKVSQQINQYKKKIMDDSKKQLKTVNALEMIKNQLMKKRQELEEENKTLMTRVFDSGSKGEATNDLLDLMQDLKQAMTGLIHDLKDREDVTDLLMDIQDSMQDSRHQETDLLNQYRSLKQSLEATKSLEGKDCLFSLSSSGLTEVEAENRRLQFLLKKTVKDLNFEADQTSYQRDIGRKSGNNESLVKDVVNFLSKKEDAIVKHY